ncbi:septum formation initiator family protein [Chelativorans sp. Marseille-P2723]|uniref:FtsB family cell division protein n=1 Tax=Chelativorans sp. Marseille-P2723 TaxID=2709133 RepID=UPI00156EC8C6|nr:septum formation initiator family protein [Chelativorans sp. Marseille-P2723]
MWTRHHKRRNTGRLITPVIAAVVLSYFGFHAYQGDYGLKAKERLSEKIVVLETELATLERTRGRLEERLSLINDGTLERDMLDEQIRRSLNLVQENEILIFRTSGQHN